MSQEYKTQPAPYALKNVAVISMKDLRKQVIDSMKDLRKQVIDALTPILKDNLVEFLNDNTTDQDWIDTYFTDFHPKNFSNEKVIQWWCDVLSDSFFQENPNVDEVLVDLCHGNGGAQNKEWLASRI